MIPLPHRAPVRRSAQRAPIHAVRSFAAPSSGWVPAQNLAQAIPNSALRLDNWFPTRTGSRIRGGCELYATVGSGDPVERIFSYVAGSDRVLFAATETDIYDVTAPADPEVSPSAAVSSLTSGYWSVEQFTTVGGTFLMCVNGADALQRFDGSSWDAITDTGGGAITGVATSDLSHVWSYRRRLFFLVKDSLSFAYLGTGAIAGAATVDSLAGVFRKGGTLMFGATWSVDAGDGMDDKCVFVSSLGEVAIYEGGNPADADAWSLVGRYDLAPPLGKNAVFTVGGDLLIATEIGIVPLTQALRKDPSTLSLAAMTRAIETEWRREVDVRRSLPFEVVKWPERTMAVVSLPRPNEEVPRHCFAVNLETGAWARFVGWDTRCLGWSDGRGFFGTNDGRLMEMERTGSDAGQPYEAVYVGAFDNLDQTPATKLVSKVRATFLDSQAIQPQLSVSTNYHVSVPPSPAAAPDVTVGSLWDIALWDVDTWDALGVQVSATTWRAIGRSGYAVAPQIQVTIANTNAPTAELVSFDLVYMGGAVVV